MMATAQNVTPPYHEGFDEENSLESFTVIDANNDGRKWKRSNEFGEPEASYTSSNRKADDWLITPGITLRKGMTYKVSFSTKAYSSKFPERLEVKYGGSPTAESMQGVILEETDVNFSRAKTFEKEIIPKEDMTAYFGFHCTSDADMYTLVVDDIRVSAGTSAEAPDTIPSIKAMADGGGRLTATVTLTAPTLNIAGGQLASLDKITVYRDGTQVAEITDAVPGKEYSVEDTEAAEGFNTYTAKAANSYGEGKKGNGVRVYVGKDTPSYPADATLADRTTAIRASWTAISRGLNGGYVDPAEVTYKLYQLDTDMFGQLTATEVASTTGATEADVSYDTSTGRQQVVQFGITAENPKGKSPMAYTKGIVVGEPYPLPLTEGLAHGMVNSGLWFFSGNGTFSVSTSLSQDEGGSFAYKSEDGNAVATVNSGKISLGSAANPKLIFSHYATPGRQATLKVEVGKPDGTYEEASLTDYSSMQGDAQWRRTAVSLSKYASLPYITLSFSAQAEPGLTVAVDAIEVRQVEAHDLRASVATPPKATMGKPCTIKVKVENTGDNEAKGHTMTLLAGDEVIGRAEPAALAAYASETAEFEYTPSVLGAKGDVQITATVNYDADRNKDDNTATATMPVTDSPKPAPAAATATEQQGGAVAVGWQEPAETQQTVEEGFDEYDSWATDGFGQWTCFYGQKGATGELDYNVPYPHQGEKFAYIVFDPEDWMPGKSESDPWWAARSGEKFLASVYSLDDEGYVNHDDWLVSPTLSGEAQTVSFWAKADAQYPAVMETLWSDGQTEAGAFSKTGKTVVAGSGEWQEVTFDVPSGARRFAIHNITMGSNAYTLFIDDVTFKTEAGRVTGYNVYRNGTLIGKADAEARSFSDNGAPQGANTYAVTAMYDDGESGAAIASITTAINSAKADQNADAKIYDLSGREVNKPAKGIYVVKGKKVKK